MCALTETESNVGVELDDTVTLHVALRRVYFCLDKKHITLNNLSYI